MRRSFIISSVLAGTALLGACSGTATNNQAPNKPVNTTPSPVTTVSPAASPVASPAVSPVASPAKPGATPAANRPDLKGTPEKKPAETPKAN
jgi:hypothetical protein